MPLDSKGTYRHNDQSARMHSTDREAMKNKILDGKSEPNDDNPEDTDDQMTEVHNHGDGTFHTVHNGEEEQHETIGHMHAHLSKLHGEPGEKHFHAHDDGVEAHSHSVETDGEPEHEEHDAGNIEAIKDHLGRFFDEEEHEGEREDGDHESEENTVGGLTGSRALGM